MTGFLLLTCSMKSGNIALLSTVPVCIWLLHTCIPVADPEGGGGGRGFNPPLSEVFFVFCFFCLSVYENSHGPGP